MEGPEREDHEEVPVAYRALSHAPATPPGPRSRPPPRSFRRSTSTADLGGGAWCRPSPRPPASWGRREEPARAPPPASRSVSCPKRIPAGQGLTEGSEVADARHHLQADRGPEDPLISLRDIEDH